MEELERSSTENKDDALVSLEYWAGNPSIRILEGVLHCWPSTSSCRRHPTPDLSQLRHHVQYLHGGKSAAAGSDEPVGGMRSRKNSLLSIESNHSNEADRQARGVSQPSSGRTTPTPIAEQPPSYLVLASQIPHHMPPAEFAEFLLEDRSYSRQGAAVSSPSKGKGGRQDEKQEEPSGQVTDDKSKVSALADDKANSKTSDDKTKEESDSRPLPGMAVRHAMVLRGTANESYMMLLSVGESIDDACNLVDAFDGKRYNNLLEPDAVCRMYVVVPLPENVSLAARRRHPLPFTPLSEPGAMASVAGFDKSTVQCTVCLEPIDDKSSEGQQLQQKVAGASACTSASASSKSKKKKAKPPPESDQHEIGGGFCLTILCGHSFHWKC